VWRKWRTASQVVKQGLTVGSSVQGSKNRVEQFNESGKIVEQEM
jgi:hypothetical protein